MTGFPKPPTPPFPPLPGPAASLPAEPPGLPGRLGESPATPVGAIVAFPGPIQGKDTPPAPFTTDFDHYGWRICNGDALSTIEYPDLFAALGYLYGGSGTTFNLPNFEGQFLRAVDSGDGKDLDRDKRTGPPGDASSTGVGSTQTQALQDHKHKTPLQQMAPIPGETPPDPPLAAATANQIKTDWVDATENKGKGDVDLSDNETRPTNIYVYWLIKCQPDAAQMTRTLF